MNARRSMPPSKYRPSTGTEGFAFLCEWCARCERDRDEDCPIVAATFRLDVHEPGYPAEWCIDAAGRPQCTAFVPEGEPVPPPRCSRTLDMFEERAR